MRTIESERIVADFMKATWNAADPDAADRFLHPAYRDHAYAGGNADGLKAAIRELSSAMPDHRQEIEDVVAEDDRVMLRLRLRATHTGTFRGRAPTGRPIDVRVARWFRIDDGRIIEHWALLDTFNLFRQMEA